ncbi:ATP-binding cassette domain-containing protein [Haloarcula nitratireducens]|uniref:ATP-binding cassette domain-containing protein n=1 Tax=Haloarcula nitratireducens TaxID=2487749 RepID=A0AAW4PG66_9EURY|nr:ATP-binding cassette domain-containing protein [Halomicroarcula nitratireducens]
MPSSTSSSEDTIFVADDISHQFGTVTVLDEISLSVKTGEFLALVGPNGSGKTTLLQIITGLLTPSEGTIARPSGSARPIGYLPQHPNLRASQTVRETLEFYGTLLADATDTGRILETIGLSGRQP